MRQPYDIVVTWPKTTPLDAYVANLRKAVLEGKEINYRVSRLPRWSNAVTSHGVQSWAFGVEHPNCHMVWNGRVRGHLEILYTCYRQPNEVEGWPAGYYIVRSPVWYPAEDRWDMVGFQGWRWFDPTKLAGTH